MKYIKTYEFFKPIKINSAKPFKVKKNIDKSMQHLQKGIKSLRTRLEDQKSAKSRSKMNQEINNRIQKLKDLNFKKLKQAEYFRNNPVKESLDENEKKLLDILSSENFKPEDIEKYIGLPDDKYDIDIQYEWDDSKRLYNEKEFQLKINSDTLEDLMNIERGVLDFYLRTTSYYGDYEYNVDDDELDYLDRYLPDELLAKIKKLGELFGLDIDPNEEGKINELFTYLSLDDVLDDCKMEIASENERAVKKSTQKELDSLPFDIDYTYSNSQFNLQLTFEYDTIIEYMIENKIEVKNLKEFIENISTDFDYSIEYESSEYTEGFKDLIELIKNKVKKYLKEPDELFPILIEKDNLELFKNKIDLAFFTFEYDGWYGGQYREKLNLFEISKRYKNKFLEWFKTYDFQKNIIENNYDKVELYKELKKADIIDPKIEDEYSYFIDAEKYNL